MIDSFDYKEPSCSLCGGKEFYNLDKDAPIGRIPVMRVIEKLDYYLDRNRTGEAHTHLEYWAKEAVELKDKQGELAVVDELIGFYRKAGEKELALKSCKRALSLVSELSLNDSVTSATVLLNVATAYKAFGMAKEAIPVYEQTFELYKKFLPENDVKNAGLFNNMALALVDLKRYKEAEDLYAKAIELTDKAENGKPDEAISYINLAHCYYDQKKDKDMITDCLFKAYELLNAEDVLQNGYLAFVLSKCYPSYTFFGYDKVAEELKQRSEELYARD